MSLSNRLAIVTGAAGGIGLEVAKSFAKEGACVILVDINELVHERATALNNEHPHQLKHSSFVCDVSSEEQVESTFEAIHRVYTEKTPDVIVNNAGIFIDRTMLDSTADDFDKTINTNLRSAFLVTKAAARDLVANFANVKDKLGKTETYASIINMASIAGQRSFWGNACHYSASKAGMEALVRMFAHELGQYKIRCNAVCPGPIMSPLQDNAERLAYHIGLTKLGRVGEAHEGELLLLHYIFEINF